MRAWASSNKKAIQCKGGSEFIIKIPAYLRCMPFLASDIQHVCASSCTFTRIFHTLFKRGQHIVPHLHFPYEKHKFHAKSVATPFDLLHVATLVHHIRNNSHKQCLIHKWRSYKENLSSLFNLQLNLNISFKSITVFITNIVCKLIQNLLQSTNNYQDITISNIFLKQLFDAEKKTEGEVLQITFHTIFVHG